MKEEIERAIAVLKKGGLILYPTDTVWGIGCDATNPDAVRRVYELKRSDNKQSMIILVDNIDNVSRYTGNVPDVAWQMMELTDKPLTVILPGGCGIAENLIPVDGTIGIRVPDHEFCHNLLRRFHRPIVSTSANITGEPAPVNFGDISEEIKKGVDMVVDRSYEKGATRKPSSIVKLGPGGQIEIIRS